MEILLGILTKSKNKNSAAVVEVEVGRGINHVFYLFSPSCGF